MRSTLTLLACLVAGNAQAVDWTAGATAGGLFLNNSHELYNIETGKPLSQPLTLSLGLRAGVGVTPWLQIEGEADLGAGTGGRARANVVGLRIGPRFVARDLFGSPIDLHATAGIGSLSVLGPSDKSGRDTDMVVHAGPGVAVTVARSVSIRADWRLLGTSHLGPSKTPSLQHLVTLGVGVRFGANDATDAVAGARASAEQAAVAAARAVSAEARAVAQAELAAQAARAAAAAELSEQRAEASAQAERANTASRAASDAADEAAHAAAVAEEAARIATRFAESSPRAAASAAAAVADSARATAAAVTARQAALDASTAALAATASAARAQAAPDAKAAAEAAMGAQAAASDAVAAAWLAGAAAVEAAAVESKISALDLDGIQFDSGRATVKASAIPVLKHIAQVLREHPDVRQLRIEGHTDDVGSAEGNLALSQARVDEAVRILIEEGVDRSRLDAQGFGEAQPVADNATSAGRRENRRVTFTVLQ